jgi:hypothetical protein
MRIERKFDLFQDLFGQPIVAYADDRVEMVGQTTQVSDLFGVQGGISLIQKGRHSSICEPAHENITDEKVENEQKLDAGARQ